MEQGRETRNKPCMCTANWFFNKGTKSIREKGQSPTVRVGGKSGYLYLEK